MTEITILHNQLIAAMHELAAAEAEDESADRDYDGTLARYDALFKAENPAVVERAKAAADRLSQASAKFGELRKAAKEALTGDDRLENLPEGFKQTKEKTLDFYETFSPGMLRDEIMKECPALMVVDMKALEKLAFLHAEENGTGGFNLPAWIMRLGVGVKMSYKASISDVTLKKLTPDETLQDTPQDGTGAIDDTGITVTNGDAIEKQNTEVFDRLKQSAGDLLREFDDIPF